ncbi:MAG: sigma-70 family RNA polymerase sigma factor [Planctomycetes bacterium]|nr:sigma-70 family RNA polymerase sigma factor [Planctomycetota bacterium]
MFDNEADIRLMLGVKARDTRAFEELYRQYSGRILNYLFRLHWDRALAEDLLQEVFLRVWKGAQDYQPTGKVSAYIFKVAHNVWLNDREKKRPRLFSSLERHGDGGGDPTPVEFEGHEDSPDESALREELRAEVRRAIETLSDKERSVLMLSEFEGFKYQEIADILQIPVGTVKSRMAHAAERLKARLEKYVKRT